MKDEYLDIVDENNNLLNIKKLRSKAHRQGLWHRTVHIYIFNNNKEFLFHLSSKDKDLNPNKWDTRFGGHIKAGENIDKAVINELKEEVGLNIKIPSLIKGPIFKRDKGVNKEFTNVYYFKYNNDLNKLTFNDGEVQKVEWMNATDIINSISSNGEKWAAGVKNFKKVNNYLAKTLIK